MTNLTIEHDNTAYLDVARVHGEIEGGEAAEGAAGIGAFWFEVPTRLIPGLCAFLSTPGRWSLETRPVGRFFRGGYRWEMPEVTWQWSTDGDGWPLLRLTANLFDDEGVAEPPVLDGFVLAKFSVEEVDAVLAALTPLAH